MEQSVLRQVQLVQLEIAKEVKRVCTEIGAEYFLDYGTLLGAVRHKGFIPWDDDMDLGMLRADYDRFLQLAPRVMDSQYQLITWETEKDYPHYYAKVMKKGTLYQEEAHHGSSSAGIFIDIFPYDPLPDDERERVVLTRRQKILRAIIRAKCGHRTWTVQGKVHVMRWFKNLPFQLISPLCQIESLHKTYLRNYTGYEITNRCYGTGGILEEGVVPIPKDLLNSRGILHFEDTEFTVPLNYKEYLDLLYGDYMTPPPERERDNRHSISVVCFDTNIQEDIV